MLIDMHAHIVPERFPPAGQRASAGRWPSMDHFESGRARVMIAGNNFRTVTSQCWDMNRRIEDMAREGVDAQVLSPMPELLSYWFTPQDGLEMCRCLNDVIANMVQAVPSRFHGLGVVPLQDPDLAARELTEVKARGLLGVEIGSNINGVSLGDERFLPFFQEAERLGLSVFVHALHPTFTDRIIGPDAAVNAVGFPTDTGLTIASLITSLTLERCPRLRVAVSHGGGSFAFILPRMENAWARTWNGEPPAPDAPETPLRDLLPKSPAAYAKTLYYDTLLFDRRAIRYLMEMVGLGQLLVGTDYPFAEREQPVGKTLRTMGLSDQDLETITSSNCLRFLGLMENAPAKQRPS
jgi:aminocarboxymuconate-semialdehyde decarboxylase